MPRYFFHVHNHIEVEDEEGQELPDVAAAHAMALRAARDMVCESVHAGHLNLDHYINVTNEGGQDILVMKFREAFTLES